MKLYLILQVLLLYTSAAIIKPPFWEKAETARWLAHKNLWGTLSTSSVRLQGQAWGQPKSFVDGSSSNATGVLYFYDSDMDASMEDIKANPQVAFSLSSAQIFGMCPVDRLDPENPRCARVVFSGKFVLVTDEEELNFAKSSLFERHPEMETWPEDHSWKVHKILLNEVWLIDIYGGGRFPTTCLSYFEKILTFSIFLINSCDCGRRRLLCSRYERR